MSKLEATLWALARCPFLAADDLAVLQGTGARAARAHLLRLCRAGLVDGVHVPRTRLHLYYLTPTGIATAARAADTDPEVLAARYGLGERALLRRLPGLERLVAGRAVLLALHRALAARGAVLEEWRAWPVSWRYTLGTQRRVVHLDGEGLIRQPGLPLAPLAFGFLWDGEGTAPTALLAERLARLDLLYQAQAARGRPAAAIPPALLVTAAPERVPAGYRPDLLWTTCAAIAHHGVLEAGWRGSSTRGEGLSLLAALATLRPRPVQLLPGPTRPAYSTASTHEETRRPVRLQQRTHAVRHGPYAEKSLCLLAIALPPRGHVLLDLIGRHPLLCAADIARVAQVNRVDTWTTLALLRRQGLVDAWTPPRVRRARRHVLTQRGLRLLALRADVTPEAYRRIYAVLDDTEHRTRRGLAFARANLAHTDGLNAVYLALLGAARAAGGTLRWRGEWACTHTFAAGAHLHTLRPDAEGWYAGPTGALHFFVEVDRGTTRLWRLTAKLAQYAAYRAQAACAHVTLLLVTSGPERGRRAVALNESLAAQTGRPLLDLRVTALAELAQQGRTSGRAFDADGLLHPHAGRDRPTQDTQRPEQDRR